MQEGLRARWPERSQRGNREEVPLDCEPLPPHSKAQQHRSQSGEKTCATHTAVVGCCGGEDTPVCSCDRRARKGACLRSESAGFQGGISRGKITQIPGPPGRASPGNSRLSRLAAHPG